MFFSVAGVFEIHIKVVGASIWVIYISLSLSLCMFIWVAIAPFTMCLKQIAKHGIELP